MFAALLSNTNSAPWRRSERLAVTLGGVAFGAMLGLFVALFAGRMGGEGLLAAPILASALLLSGLTFWRAKLRGSHGCATAACLHMIGVAAWPLMMMIPNLPGAMFWLAPMLALSALGMFASCWQGKSWAIYGAAGQAAMLAALAAHQSMFVMLGV